MSRIRSVHPTFFTDDDTTKVSFPGRLLLIGLLTQADDHGVFEWKPGQIKKELFPDQAVEVADLLRELERHDRIRTFETDGRKYGVIRNFVRYQKPKKPSYRFPLPPELAEYVGYEKAQPPKAGKGADAASTGPQPEVEDRNRKTDIGTKSDVCEAPSSLPPPGREEPPPGSSPRRGEERSRREASSVRSSLSSPRAEPPPPANDVGASDRACRALIAAFDDAIVAEWGTAARRPMPAGTDFPTARAWLALGADAALVTEIARRQLPGMHERNFVPKMLKVLDSEMRAACADRQRRVAEGPRDEERDKWLPRMTAYQRGTWLDAWGEKPGDAGCSMPRRLQDEVLKGKVA